ncbi:MAG TPA: asparagine synthase-related protein [Gemmatimonadota bacterium]|nr:asparagine synthase-related protein [Gemmatimonadota bacterium]
MSGICGVVMGGGSAVEPGVVAAMVGAASHRGPDGTGEWSEGSAALGQLALDLSAGAGASAGSGARQPVVGPGGGPVLVADARVDNRDELLAALGTDRPAGGAPSDGELLLAAYRRWGIGCAAHVLGDFAFAVWDRSRQRLFCARDPMGMRALYYRVEPGRVLFATEVKQILAVPGVPCQIFEPAVAGYLAGAFGRLEWSFYEGIDQLPPAHALVVEAGGHRTWRYWDADPGERIEYAAEDDYAAHFLELFKAAVRSRLRSARPVGVSLSGGLDSGSIAATAGWLMHHEPDHGPPALRAYSYAFQELAACDERYISDRIAGHWQIPVTAVPADDAWPLVDYPEHGPDRDAPHLFVYQARIERTLAAARADGVATLLSGDRGDLVAGEYIYDYPGLLRSGRWPTLARELRWLGALRGRSTLWAVRNYLLGPTLRFGFPENRTPRLQRPILRAYRALRPPRRMLPPWLAPEMKASLDDFAVDLSGRPGSSMVGIARRQRYAVIFTPVHMRWVVHSERTAARFGVAFADPWSDLRLARFALAIPQRVLNRTGEDKRLTRRAMRGVMEESARQSARKIPPTPLWELALRDRARDTILDLIEGSRAADRGWIDGAGLRSHYREIEAGGREHPYFWYTLALEWWLRLHG